MSDADFNASFSILTNLGINDQRKPNTDYTKEDFMYAFTVVVIHMPHAFSPEGDTDRELTYQEKNHLRLRFG